MENIHRKESRQQRFKRLVDKIHTICSISTWPQRSKKDYSNFMDKGWCVWFTGLPCSGKSTLAYMLSKKLGVVWLDDDGTRQITPEQCIQRTIGVATYLTYQGENIICSYVSPYEFIRNQIREVINKLLIVHVNCPLPICAKRGEIKNFTGIYEKPKNPDLVLHTHKWDVTFCVAAIMAIMQERGYICEN